MNDNMKMKRIDEIAAEDELYQRMLEELRPYEENLDSLCARLPLFDRGIIWDFIMRCEDISKRKLLLACRNMEFRNVD